MKDFVNYLRASDNLLYVLTYEENEFIEDLCEAARKDNTKGYKVPKKIYVFSRPTGLYTLDPNGALIYNPKKVIDRINTFPDLFGFIRNFKYGISNKENNLLSKIRGESSENKDEDKDNNKEEIIDKEDDSAIFIIKDLHLYFNDKDVMRNLRDLCETFGKIKNVNTCHIIVTSPVLELPPELEKIFTLFEYPLWDKEEIADYTRDICLKGCKMSTEEWQAVSEALVGLTKREVIRALSHSMAKYKPEIHLELADLHSTKIQIVKKSGALDFIVPQHTMDDLGGCDNFKTWVRKIKSAMTPEAVKFGIPQPKGAMLVGVPGTSKTVSAEILASYLKIPLLSLNIARVMGSYVGQSEHRIMEALRIAKSVAPCVLLLDECEKVLGGHMSSNATDSGTLSRVMAQILNFLQEDNTGIITIMTSNDVSQLPPELTRSGRIDAQWMFDLPNEVERGEIIDIYIKKQNLVLNAPERLYLIQATENFTGAEIKSAVKEILVNLFYRQQESGSTDINRIVTTKDIDAGVNNVVTVYQSSREKIESFRNFAASRYLNASKSIEEIKDASMNFKIPGSNHTRPSAKKIISMED